MTDDDWDILFAWSSDPEILHDTDGNDARGYDLAQAQDIYRGVSRRAYCFIAEVECELIGEAATFGHLPRLL